MIRKTENKKLDITRRNGQVFKHYQILVKILNGEQTQQHTIEVFTGGPGQLLDMRRVYAKLVGQQDLRQTRRIAKNN